MASYIIKDFRVDVLPTIGTPNSRYYVLNGQGTDIDEYITDKYGSYHKVNPIVVSSSTSFITRVAGENISSGMAVIIGTDNKIYKYDITNENHCGLSVGIAKTSGITGNNMNVTLPGSIITEVGSGWQSGESYFVSATSILTTTPPLVGVIKKIGTGIDTDTILINNYNELILI